MSTAPIHRLQGQPWPAGLWRADQLDSTPMPTCPSGHAALDAQLPGGGWPLGWLTELLLAEPGQGEWRLLAPVLARLTQGRPGEPGREVVCIGSPGPWRTYAPGLAALGLALPRLLWVETDAEAEGAWAAEQALRSGAAAAVIWWAWGPAAAPQAHGHANGSARPPQPSTAAPHPPHRLSTGLPTALPTGLPTHRRGVPPRPSHSHSTTLSTGPANSGLAKQGRLGMHLRRLHLAAQGRPVLLWVLRPLAAAAQSSPAALRLACRADALQPGQLQLELLKRRGPPLAQPLELDLRSALGLPLAHRLSQPLPMPSLPPTPVPTPPSTPVRQPVRPSRPAAPPPPRPWPFPERALPPTTSPLSTPPPAPAPPPFPPLPPSPPSPPRHERPVVVPAPAAPAAGRPGALA
ncbi:MAG: hypothetical protein IPG57_09160 [Burkholderiales bacterium]|jgi:protein ImuA|nr:hypothetical protein [Burkholderiales bacterium]